MSYFNTNIGVKRAQMWQSAFIRGELGCNPLDFTNDIEKAIAAHMRENPERSTSQPKRKAQTTNKKHLCLKLLNL